MKGTFHVTTCRRCAGRTDATRFACVFCGLAFAAVIPMRAPDPEPRSVCVETGRAITTISMGEQI